MRVITPTFEYTLYIGADGVWTMHTWLVEPRADGSRWLDTSHNVSNTDPFSVRVESAVLYNAWR